MPPDSRRALRGARGPLMSIRTAAGEAQSPASGHETPCADDSTPVPEPPSLTFLGAATWLSWLLVDLAMTGVLSAAEGSSREAA
jgi:hypothetical protein